MKIKFLILSVLFLLHPVNVHARVPADFLIRNYTVSLKVYDISTAFEQLNDLPGINMHNFSDIVSGFGHMDYRVPIAELDDFFYILENSGEIVQSSSTAANVFSRIVNLETQLSVREGEYERMNELLLMVESIDDFYFVESRLSNVIWNMNHIIGQLGTYELNTAAARINVFIYTEDTLPVFEPVTGFARVGYAFTTSAGMTLNVIQAIVIFFAYVSIPLIFLTIIGLCVKRLLKGRFVFVKGKKEELSDENSG